MCDDKATTNALQAQLEPLLAVYSHCWMLHWIDLTEILFGFVWAGFFALQNESLYLPCKSVKGAGAVGTEQWHGGSLMSIEQWHCGSPLPLTPELCRFLRGLPSCGVQCRCLPLVGCGFVSSAKLLATLLSFQGRWLFSEIASPLCL